jgi:hypothetical protein
MVKATETLGSFDMTAKAFESLQKWKPEYTADSMTIYIELLKEYLAFFLPSVAIDYPSRESDLYHIPNQNITTSSPQRGQTSISSGKFIGRSWNLFTAK